ncbi:hypothetical protein HPP92_001892 [Vanilla planifolia]|uniref:Lysine-specific demethylase JMJ25 n=1 Tax=Vanilla planifolia TaxID=51239 RepID=A0A835S4W6_VANPL|nr:hypothetical protein HPP92_002139 [Vanilla planifolia]KAG0501820.1 hypothetical protein HPP92_001892 [Vanilla planifolia]
MEDNGGIPEDLRCKRSDGKQWRCSAQSMPDKTVCEKHYIQAKRRAMNSAMRAHLRKASKRKSLDNSEIYLVSRRGERDLSRSPVSPMNPAEEAELSVLASMPRLRKHKERISRSNGFYSPDMDHARDSPVRGGLHPRKALQVEDGRARLVQTTPSRKGAQNYIGNGAGHECSGKSSDSSGGAEGITCHHCRRNDRVNVFVHFFVYPMNLPDSWRCSGMLRYQWMKFEKHAQLVETKLEGIAAMDRLRYLHSLLSFTLPVIKQIYSEQCFEISMEKKYICDLCKIPIFDYHRHCSQCMFDLCLTCCCAIRRAYFVGDKGMSDVDKTSDAKLLPQSADTGCLDISNLFPEWKANNDGSIPCGPEEAGGCGFTKLILRRILKINWTGKLLKNAEEMVNGCKGSDLHGPGLCASYCLETPTSHLNSSIQAVLLQCSFRDDNTENFLYYPAAEDIKHEGIRYFHKFWVRGQPVIVKNVFEPTLASGWDPMDIWKGVQETLDEELKEDIIVKAIDYENQSEVDIELSKFIRGYAEGCKDESGREKLLKLKDWPPPSALEEFLLCHRPEFLGNFPLVEFIHWKWGLLNLVSKLPHNTLQYEVVPKIFITYGTRKELGVGDPVTKLRINMSDMACLLMDTIDTDCWHQQRNRVEKHDKISKKVDGSNSLDGHGRIDIDEFTVAVDRRSCSSTGVSILEKKGSEYLPLNECSVKNFENAGTVWDIFRRQDVPKLNEFLRVHLDKFANFDATPVYEQSLYLNDEYKRKLKDEFNVEPWTFQQHVGEAVFVPAGCPFQVRNLQSSVQLAFDFLTPESLGESLRMSQEIRCLPSNHEAKLRMLEVGKISLYAASFAIKEVQSIVLDPKYSSEVKFEDRRLTVMVHENLERVAKRRQIACS